MTVEEAIAVAKGTAYVSSGWTIVVLSALAALFVITLVDWIAGLGLLLAGTGAGLILGSIGHRHWTAARQHTGEGTA